MLVYVYIINLHKKLTKVVVPTRQREQGSRVYYIFLLFQLFVMHIHFLKIRTLCIITVDTDKYLIFLTRILFY